MWRLNGKRSDFTMGPGTRFAFQHDAEREADGTLSLFDNSASPPVRKRSRAVFLRLDEQARTAQLALAFSHPAGLLAANQGNVERLSNGDVLVGWGSQRAFFEHAADGRLLLDARIARGNDSYRVYRQGWSGPRPGRRARPPSHAAAGAPPSSRAGTRHGLASWEILAGRHSNALAPVATVPRTGFETGSTVAATGPFFAVRARNAAGAVLRTSRVVRRRR